MPTIQYLEIDGARIGYAAHPSVPGRPALVFVHGYALSSTGGVYAELLAALAQDFNVLAFDFRGHGASAEVRGSWTFDNVADDLAYFVSELGIKDAFYVGHSTGGLVGLVAAAKYPDLFAALGLLASAPAVAGQDLPPDAIPTFEQGGRDRRTMEAVFAPMYLRHPVEVMTSALDDVCCIDPSVHRAFLEHYAQFRCTDRLGDIQAPVLMINGANDVVVQPSAQHDTANAIPRCKEVILSDQGHMLPVEAPHVVASELELFWRQARGLLFRSSMSRSAVVARTASKEGSTAPPNSGTAQLAPRTYAIMGLTTVATFTTLASIHQLFFTHSVFA